MSQLSAFDHQQLSGDEFQAIESQCVQIKRDLLKGRRITALDALKRYNCLNLKGRIFDLRSDGLPVVTQMMLTKTKKRIAVYYVETKKN